MSYARFSSDNWKSDVYCYESDAGFELTVAGNRLENLDTLTQLDFGNFIETYTAQMKEIGGRVRVPIGLPHDGEFYTFSTLEELRDKLLELREVGYHVPQYALDSIEEEMQENVPSV